MKFKPLKKLTPILQVLYRNYTSRTRPFKYNGLFILVHPDVFNPRFIISTKIFLDYLNKQELSSKRFLDLGAGSGIMSLLAASKGAVVTASDINPAAVENIRENADRTGLRITVVLSDLFAGITGNDFDFIVISPPYFPKNPANFNEMAWYCGKDFEYYRRLFPQLLEHWNPNQEILMILSDDCKIDRIREIASESGFLLYEVHRKKRMWEWNFIFRIALQH